MYTMQLYMYVWYILGLNSWYSNDCLCWERSSIFLKFDYVYICHDVQLIACTYLEDQITFTCTIRSISHYSCAGKRVEYLWSLNTCTSVHVFPICCMYMYLDNHITCTIKSFSHMYIHYVYLYVDLGWSHYFWWR